MCIYLKFNELIFPDRVASFQFKRSFMLMKFLMFFSLLIPQVVKANVTLPSVISDNMVLQQKAKVKLWGWGLSNEKIYIRPSWNTSVDSTIVAANSKWTCWIETPSAGGPYNIEIKGYNTINLSNVLIGEVWLCSGQSNMEMSVNWGLNYKEEVQNASNDNIRFLQVLKTTAEYPQEDLKAKWEVSSPSSMSNFSAVAYFFAKKLQQELNVPVGVINSSWGGSPAEVWTPTDIIRKDSSLNKAANNLSPTSYSSVKPGDNYNSMIHPLTNYKIAGVLWYQGEANVGQTTYASLLKSLITSWRNAWNQNFPFYYAQIAPWAGYGKSISAPLIRESQTIVQELPGTGMILTSDLVDDINDIHPKLKKEVGERFANYALEETYGIKKAPYKTPEFRDMQIKNGKAILSFTNAESGLVSKTGKVNGFFIAGTDQVFIPANALIKGKKVVVWSENIKEPVAVRYGFTSDGVADLFNKEGMPVNLFRTDNWGVNTIKN